MTRLKGIHVLVLEAFVGPRPRGSSPRAYHAAHENGVAGDDRLENLAWKTVRENCLDKQRHGTQTVRPTKVLEDGTELFQCRKCEAWKPRDGFNRLYNKASKCKLESECKKCRTEYVRHYSYARDHGITIEEAMKIERNYTRAA